MRNERLLPQGTVRIGHRNPQPPSPPVLIRTGPTVPRTVQSPNALGPACAGLFLFVNLCTRRDLVCAGAPLVGCPAMAKRAPTRGAPTQIQCGTMAVNAARRSTRRACVRACCPRGSAPAPQRSSHARHPRRIPAGSSCALFRSSPRASASVAPRCGR